MRRLPHSSNRVALGSCNRPASERQKTLEQAQQRIKTLENEASENLQRQQLLQEELIKAEAQIELIKDLLLREPGL